MKDRFIWNFHPGFVEMLNLKGVKVCVSDHQIYCASFLWMSTKEKIIEERNPSENRQ